MKSESRNNLPALSTWLNCFLTARSNHGVYGFNSASACSIVGASSLGFDLRHPRPTVRGRLFLAIDRTAEGFCQRVSGLADALADAQQVLFT